MSATFRAGVGAVILDARRRVLALERSAIRGAWQLPQGGIEGDEAPVDALWRELREETGLTVADLELWHEVPEWLGYELPPDARTGKTGRGQVHKWFVLLVRDRNIGVHLGAGPGAEFGTWRWQPLAELADQVAPFRQPVYRRLATIVAELNARS